MRLKSAEYKCSNNYCMNETFSKDVLCQECDALKGLDVLRTGCNSFNNGAGHQLRILVSKHPQSKTLSYNTEPFIPMTDTSIDINRLELICKAIQCDTLIITDKTATLTYEVGV